ncbi:DUF6230 family protein [Brevibacterium casei]|uniref:Cholesterol esterase n=2 Tax=Brevibacterium casei TaxID=33889 RepID=K9AFL8_9MICO|nr:DUF6230 family protein [Brevibacterium casei]NJE67020.1 cholesterol esterase [Brevibacterium sp. LS14]EKU46083.1 hypothetical protein C272_12557 [Brevibacterium casei S18]MBE4693165.1 cholesterol esterase [Brevibacterium casei]MBY3576288.1 cholesterol esterase [Brevibacterium casei]MCT1764670.1 DUF6230 family protein [Brevibacterium casei]
MKFPKFRHISKLTSSYAGRIALVAIPAGVVSAGLMGGVAQGAVPVSFSVSGSQFQISASQLEGTGFSQYGGTAEDSEGGKHTVAIANIKSAELSDLCQSAVTDTPLGKAGVLITAGGGGQPATASDLQIGMTGLKGDAEFSNIRIGVDASDVNTKAKGTAGDFAQDSDTISISGLEQTAWSTQASVFTLKGMKLELTDGSKTCF